MPARRTKEQFIAKARKVHRDRYDYWEVDYVNCETKVTIICGQHGELRRKRAASNKKK